MPVLLVGDNACDPPRLQQLVTQAGFDCRAVSTASPLPAREEMSTGSLVLLAGFPADVGFAPFLQSLQERYPTVPLVAITGHRTGIPSKDALPAGIDGCVPRSGVDTDLARTLKTLLNSESSERIVCYTLDSNSELLPLIVTEVRRRLEQTQFLDSIELVRITVALNEALDNALYHGNLELSSELRQGDGRAWRAESLRRRTMDPYRRRRIRFQATFQNHAVRFSIRDEGVGFNPGNQADCTKTQNLERCSGRGLLLMQMYMDDVDFNDTGNEVIMIKNRASQNGANH